MFGNTKKPGNTPASSSQNLSTSGINSLVSGTSIEGTIIAQSDIRIDGELKGSVQCSGRVIVGSDGRLIGDIQCQNAIIEGFIEGNIDVSEELDIRETGSVNGDVKTGKLKIAPGGVFNVTCNMSGQKIKSLSTGTEA